jgi:acyl-CoA synthetase (AMP-forming)/AMP-acid ligase II
MDISLALTMAVEAHGDRVAITDSKGSMTYAELLVSATALASRLSPDATSIATVGATGSRAAICLFGAALARRAYAPLNDRLPADQIGDLARRLGCAEVLVGDAVSDEVRDAFVAAVPIDALIASPPSLFAPSEEVDGPAVLLYTSGTTAAPKAAALLHENLLAYLWNTMEFASAAPSEAALVAVPPFHIAGVAALLSSVWVGRRVVVLEPFEARAWFETAAAERVTHAFVVPTMLARLVDAADGRLVDLPDLRHLAYGGARTPVPVIERAIAVFGDVSFVNAYGMTETSSTISVLGPDDHRAAVDGDDDARRRLTSVGRPVPGIEIRVLGEDGSTVECGVAGQVQVRGDQVSGRYLGDEPACGTEGWLSTGDIGYLDEADYLFITGRGDDVIIRGGENIAAAEVEDALLRHRSVEQAVVVGLPDEEWGERIAATVVLRPGAPTTADDLRRHVRAVLGRFKTPDVIEFVDEVPLTASGKVLRREVRRGIVEATRSPPVS